MRFTVQKENEKCMINIIISILYLQSTVVWTFSHCVNINIKLYYCKAVFLFISVSSCSGWRYDGIPSPWPTLGHGRISALLRLPLSQSQTSHLCKWCEQWFLTRLNTWYTVEEIRTCNIFFLDLDLWVILIEWNCWLFDRCFVNTFGYIFWVTLSSSRL